MFKIYVETVQMEQQKKFQTTDWTVTWNVIKTCWTRVIFVSRSVEREITLIVLAYAWVTQLLTNVESASVAPQRKISMQVIYVIKMFLRTI